jgi:hypothetical protein
LTKNTVIRSLTPDASWKSDQPSANSERDRDERQIAEQAVECAAHRLCILTNTCLRRERYGLLTRSVSAGTMPYFVRPS